MSFMRATLGVPSAAWTHRSLIGLALLSVAACAERPAARVVCDAPPPPPPSTFGWSAPATGPESKAWRYPLTGDNLLRHEGNPVITGAHISDEHTLVADPYLLIANDRLYAFFEALRDPVPTDGCCGEIWMAESPDGFTWENFRQVSSGSRHFSHPHAIIHEGRVHVFYNNNSKGGIYHRSSALDEFPAWTRETEVFRGSSHGWHHLVEFAVLHHDGAWHLLGITGDDSLEDQWIRGRWAPTLPTDWNTQSQEIAPCPLLDVDHHSWVKKIVEITPLRIEDQLFLLMGATRREDGKRAIGTFAVTDLSRTKLDGVWVAGNHSFPLASSGWDDNDIHRAHAVIYKDRWIYIYDGRRKGGPWQIGVASAPLD
jgi:hypothetical protein